METSPASAAASETPIASTWATSPVATSCGTASKPRRVKNSLGRGRGEQSPGHHQDQPEAMKMIAMASGTPTPKTSVPEYDAFGSERSPTGS